MSIRRDKVGYGPMHHRIQNKGSLRVQNHEYGFRDARIASYPRSQHSVDRE